MNTNYEKVKADLLALERGTAPALSSISGSTGQRASKM